MSMKTTISGTVEGIGIALESIRANKVRAGLTILGVSVGVFVVVAIGAMITGINGAVTRDIVPGHSDRAGTGCQAENRGAQFELSVAFDPRDADDLATVHCDRGVVHVVALARRRNGEVFDL